MLDGLKISFASTVAISDLHKSPVRNSKFEPLKRNVRSVNMVPGNLNGFNLIKNVKRSDNYSIDLV